MRVVHVVSGLRAGGAEHIILELCKQSLHDPDVTMEVVSLSRINDIENKFREAGIRLFIPQSAVTSKPFTRWLLTINAIKYLREQKEIVIHAHMYYACIAACIVKLARTRIQIIFSLHNTHQPGWFKRVLLFLTKSLRTIDTTFPGTTVPYYLKKNSIPVANGINAARFNNISKEKNKIFTCLFAGRLDAQKNPLFLPELAAALRNNYDFRIVVAGDGPLMPELKQKIQHHHLEKIIELRGYVDDIDQLLGKCHCLLLPSRWEGMPLVILEAAFAELPIIATPVGNISSILDHQTAYVGNIQEFGKLLSHLIDNYEESISKTKLLKQRITEFNVANTYNEFKRLYMQLAGRS